MCGGRRAVGVAHAQVDDVLAGRARRRLQPVDLGEDVGRQAADAVELGLGHRGRPGGHRRGRLPSTFPRQRESAASARPGTLQSGGIAGGSSPKPNAPRRTRRNARACRAAARVAAGLRGPAGSGASPTACASVRGADRVRGLAAEAAHELAQLAAVADVVEAAVQIGPGDCRRRRRAAGGAGGAAGGRRCGGPARRRRFGRPAGGVGELGGAVARVLARRPRAGRWIARRCSSVSASTGRGGTLARSG